MSGAHAADFRILGPVDIRIDGVRAELSAPRLRVVLVSLLLRPGRAVAAEEIVERLWGESAAAGARTTLRSYVMRLRRTLAEAGIAGDVVRTATEGYLIDVGPGQVDLHRFYAEVEEADAARGRGDADAESRHLDRALAIPQGAALADVDSDSLYRDVALPFEERRLQLLERSFSRALERGDGAGVIPRLQALAARHPLRERFSEQLMTALYRTGRQGEALSHYHRLSAHLAEELGTDPGPRLRELFAAVLRQDADSPGDSALSRPPAARPRTAAAPTGEKAPDASAAPEPPDAPVEGGRSAEDGPVEPSGAPQPSRPGRGPAAASAAPVEGACRGAAAESGQPEHPRGPQPPEEGSEPERSDTPSASADEAGPDRDGADVPSNRRGPVASPAARSGEPLRPPAESGPTATARETGSSPVAAADAPFGTAEPATAPPDGGPAAGAARNQAGGDRAPALSGMPPALADFVGRTAEAEAVADAIDGGGVGLPLAAVTGPPGVGKTAFALQSAHRLADRFPDGRLYVDLRGYAAGPALRPDHVLARFLAELHVAPERIPAEVEEQTALYRSVLTGKRVLVLLDNAADAEQIRPLLPGSPGCAVIVTSRNDLRGLLLDGALPVRLSPFDRAEALRLLGAALGERALSEQPAAAGELAELCGRVPLALRIAAANILGGRGMAEYVAELRECGRLGALSVDGDPKAAVRAAFDLSHAALDPAERGLFAALGLVPGSDFTPEAAAVLADCGTAEARRTLDRLAGRHLLHPCAPGRYRMHDLLAEYAAEQARDSMTEGQRAAARERLHRHYLDVADAAGRTIAPDTRRMARPGPAAHFADTAEALAWLEAEHTNLLAAVADAAAGGPAGHAWHLVDALRASFAARTLLSDWQQTARTGLRAARAAGDRAAEAAMLHNLGSALWNSGDLQQAAARLEEALELFRALGEPEGEIAALNNLAPWHVWGGRIDHAIALFQRGVRLCDEYGLDPQGVVLEGNLGAAWESVDLARAGATLRSALERVHRLGHSGREGVLLGSLASVERNRGEPAAALELAEQALASLERRTHELQVLPVLVDVGRLHAELGDCRTARRVAARALERCVAAGARRVEADARNGWAAVRMADGDSDGARALFGQALAISEESGYRFGAAEARLGLGWSRLDAGRIATARAHAERAAHLAAGAHRILEGRAATLHAAVALATGACAAAGERAGRAAQLHRGTGARPDEAWALHLAAESAARAGAADAAAAAARAEQLHRAVGIPGERITALRATLRRAEEAHRAAAPARG
ncbi:AfsR/SARP family transcriptional regulator [Streptomonospora litoralis]|uniref:Regulatory protein AfsR n=1 Tax=Streptomonospora litoralis TaxID=2498135 RepID=A0A4P6Q5J0_9ACTN|nr:AfsR/SARP family transcriptional regulator [Streptomonospora litoralis]QBI54037.1 Regulatory protein AfsR [Streptomonospora litoralis]